MKNINDWLDKLSTFWKNHDIDGIIDLFTDDVEYWETPFNKISNSTDLRLEWENIKNQNNITLYCKVFSKQDNKYSVLWSLEFKDTNNQPKHYSGTYLLRLNLENKCDSLFQCSEIQT